MVNNIDRAEWAGEALQGFADTTMGGEVGPEAICDLICDFGHFAEIELGLSGRQFVRLLQIGIGAWSAERAALDDDPSDNDIVSITIVAGR